MPAVKSPTVTKQFTDFSGGLNRTAARQRMKDSQLYWNENAQPLGPGQLQTLPGPAVSIATVGAGISTMFGVNLKLGGVEVARLITINNDGSITAINPLNGAQTAVAPAGTVTTSARIIPWQDGPLLIGDPTTGYFSWDGTTRFKYPFTFLGDTTNGSAVVINIPSTTGYQAGNVWGLSGTGIPAGAQIKTVDSPTQITMSANATATNAGVTITVGAGAPASVTDLAVFEGRVWLISASRTISFSGPTSFGDFSVTNGAGAAAISDSVFAGSITRLLSALELLWIVGPSAINAISNVSTTGGVTTFSDTNIVANVGSVLPSSVSSFFRTFLFFAPYGIYAIVGATPQKLSDDLDGLFPLIHTGAGHPDCSAVFALNNVFVWAVFVHYVDPVAGHRPILLCFARNAWFPASQGASLSFIASLVDPTTGNPQLWGTDGSTVFQCFAGTDPYTHTIQTKLWDFGAFTQRKQLVKVAAEFNSANPVSTTITAENESGNQATALSIVPQNTLVFTGAGGAVLTFVGAGAITWITGGVQVAWGQVDFAGNYLGLKFSGTSLPFILSGLAMEIDPLGEWTFGKT